MCQGIGEFPDLKYLELIINGAGYYLGFPFTAEDYISYISGTGWCKESVEINLYVFIEGAGTVYYLVSPAVQQNVSGLDTVVSMN